MRSSSEVDAAIEAACAGDSHGTQTPVSAIGRGRWGRRRRCSVHHSIQNAIQQASFDKLVTFRSIHRSETKLGQGSAVPIASSKVRNAATLPPLPPCRHSAAMPPLCRQDCRHSAAMPPLLPPECRHAATASAAMPPCRQKLLSAATLPPEVPQYRHTAATLPPGRGQCRHPAATAAILPPGLAFGCLGSARCRGSAAVPELSPPHVTSESGWLTLHENQMVTVSLLL